jgi:hypothetical protein
MVNTCSETWWTHGHCLAQIDLRQAVAAVTQVEDAIVFGCAQGDILSGEGLRGWDVVVSEAERTVGLDLADLGLRFIFGGAIVSGMVLGLGL